MFLYKWSVEIWINLIFNSEEIVANIDGKIALAYKVLSGFFSQNSKSVQAAEFKIIFGERSLIFFFMTWISFKKKELLKLIYSTSEKYNLFLFTLIIKLNWFFKK